MAKFLSPLIAQKLNGANWEITSRLMYQSDLLKEVISIPVGFVTDFASVPRLPLAFLVAGDTCHEAAVIHDWLYQTHATTRKLSDRVLSEAMRATDVPSWRRLLIYSAVRSWGWIAWKSGPERLTFLNPT